MELDTPLQMPQSGALTIMYILLKITIQLEAKLTKDRVKSIWNAIGGSKSDRRSDLADAAGIGDNWVPLVDTLQH